MAQKNKKPKPTNQQIIQSFSNAIPLGEYRMYSSSSHLPANIPWGGVDCLCVVVAASSYTGSNIPNLPSSMTPGGNVYLWRGFRAFPSGSPPRKVDDCLYYTNRDGKAWKLHSKSSPDHHFHIMSSSGMNGLIKDHSLPSASSGTIAKYRERGAHLDFEKPFE